MAFVPRFTITSKLANQLMRIEAARQSVADLPITPAVLAPLRETARLFLGLTLRVCSSPRTFGLSRNPTGATSIWLGTAPKMQRHS